MQHSGKSQLITISDWADAATALLRHFLHTQLEVTVADAVTRAELVQQWTLTDSVTWVTALVDDEFNTQMKWARSTDDAFARLAVMIGKRFGEHFPNVDWTDGDSEAMARIRDELTYEMDPITILVAEFVNGLVGPNPWWVWSLEFRHDLLLIESDEDYRIKLFNEKVAAGEWKI